MSAIKETLKVASAGTGETLPVKGAVVRVQYEKDATSPYDSGATAKVEVMHQGFAGETILTGVSLNASGVWHPRSAAHGSDGSAIAGAFVPYFVADATVKVTVTGGGTDKTGSFLITFDT